jgi:hypothetical protein
MVHYVVRVCSWPNRQYFMAAVDAVLASGTGCAPVGRLAAALRLSSAPAVRIWSTRNARSGRPRPRSVSRVAAHCRRAWRFHDSARRASATWRPSRRTGCSTYSAPRRPVAGRSALTRLTCTSNVRPRSYRSSPPTRRSSAPTSRSSGLARDRCDWEAAEALFLQTRTDADADAAADALAAGQTPAAPWVYWATLDWSIIAAETRATPRLYSPCPALHAATRQPSEPDHRVDPLRRRPRGGTTRPESALDEGQGGGTIAHA